MCIRTPLSPQLDGTDDLPVLRHITVFKEAPTQPVCFHCTCFACCTRTYQRLRSDIHVFYCNYPHDMDR